MRKPNLIDIDKFSVLFYPSFKVPAWSRQPAERGAVLIYREGNFEVEPIIRCWSGIADHYEINNVLPAWHKARIIGEAKRLISAYMVATVGTCRACKEPVPRVSAAYHNGKLYCADCNDFDR